MKQSKEQQTCAGEMQLRTQLSPNNDPTRSAQLVAISKLYPSPETEDSRQSETTKRASPILAWRTKTLQL